MNIRKTIAWIYFVAGAFPGGALSQEFTDPKPPEVNELPADLAFPEAVDHDRLTYHAAPGPLPEGAVVEDWPRFLGPNDDGTSGETKLLAKFPEGGLKKVWEMAKGSGYTSPAIVGDRLVMFDRFGEEEVIECFHRETGKRYWRQSYPVEYEDRYGFNNGPRASAVIDSGRVYTLGVRSVLTCLDLKTGHLFWQRDLKTEFNVPNYFFGHGSCPLVHGGKIIINLGGEGGLCVAAFDQHTGKLAWGTKHQWLASYASPVVCELRGKPRLLVFAGGESDPAFGGLLCVDPETGQLLDDCPWRADMYTSVNSSGPVKVGENRVYISEAYMIGGVLLELGEDLKWKEVWRAPGFGHHWTTPILHGGHLYGYPGRNEPDTTVACLDVATGKLKWTEDYGGLIERTTLPSGQPVAIAMFRACILKADNRLYALGESGRFAILEANPDKLVYADHTDLFYARATWSLPVVSRGLLYVSQHEDDKISGAGPRLICYDFRGGE